MRGAGVSKGGGAQEVVWDGVWAVGDSGMLSSGGEGSVCAGVWWVGLQESAAVSSLSLQA